MDVITHGFVPYAILTWLRRPRSHRALAALGGIAPDLDTAFAWLSHAHPFAYPLVHRGFSHTIVGAPLMATLALLILSRAPLQRRWPRLEGFSWRPDSITPLWFGAWTHLALDALTITGVPIFWPYETTRYTTDWFFFGIFYLLPFSAYALVQLARGRGSESMVKAISLVLVALVLTSAGVRYASLPQDREPGSELTPGPNDWTWYVSVRNETGTRVYAAGPLEEARKEMFFPAYNATRAHDAIAACQRHPSYIPFQWDLWSTAVANATPTPEGGWTILFVDPAQTYAEENRPFTLPRFFGDNEEDGSARCHVDPFGVVDFDRPRGWFGS